MKQMNKEGIERIIKELGFDICEFLPDSDPCEECGETHKQLYFSGPTDSGIYLCLDCIKKMHEENEEAIKKIERLEQDGHTGHCACRQVWGDGECECRWEIRGERLYKTCEGIAMDNRIDHVWWFVFTWGGGDASFAHMPDNAKIEQYLHHNLV